ncbi:MAG: ATP-dependent 6-phosphofructokinase [Planctomycetota bacterium]|nr:ATP-dependent 6-phosphofructokinase [Planctomycetota bacterium]
MPFVAPRKIRRIAINTGGGDAPGLNAVIRAVTLSANNRGWEVIGIKRGYSSLLGGDPCVVLSNTSVRGIAHLGGTILGTTNKGNPFETYITFPGRRRRLAAEIIVEELQRLQVDGLIAVGGDGSLSIAHGLMQMGVPVIGVPKTIDNDLSGTDRTFGFDTAVSTATECLDKLHSTAQAHDRVMVVELMGRYAGWIALHAGLSSSCDVILIPEIPYDMKKVAAHLRKRKKGGRPYAIVVVAEGAVEAGGSLVFAEAKQQAREQRLGGVAEYVAERIQKMTGQETRSLVLGHLQRGGSPTTNDRLLALRFGAAAVRLAEEGKWGHMVAYKPPTMSSVPIEEAIRTRKLVSVTSDTIMTVRELGVCLGD